MRKSQQDSCNVKSPSPALRGRVGVGVLFLLLLLFVVACADEQFSTDPSYRLTFSEDEVVMDTLITGVSSRTTTLTVYNRNKQGVRIKRVALGKGAESPFRANVDGWYLYDGEGSDFEIFSGDSIIVRIEVGATITPGLEIEQLTDNLTFTLESGVTQTLPLSAGVLDAEMRFGVYIEQDSVIAGTKPIVIHDSLVVERGATLTIAEGTALMFHHDVNLMVRGTLKVQGTVERPVTLRSDQTEHMFKNLYYDNTPNRWGGVVLDSCSTGNVILNCDLHAASFGIVSLRQTTEGTALRMENSVIHNVGGHGLSLHGCRTYVANTQISNTFGHCLDIDGGHHDFLHCTIAQFYPFDARRGDALYMAGSAVETDDPEQPLYLERAHFLNCVITGYGDDVIMGDIREDEELLCDYLFHHCYLNTVKSTDEARFVGITYDDDEQPLSREKNFQLFDTELFLYDFTPADSSSIRGMADPAIALPTDRLGRPRREEGKADAGCYEGSSNPLP